LALKGGAVEVTRFSLKVVSLNLVVATIGAGGFQGEIPEVLWERTYGNSPMSCGYSVQQTTDGGYIIAGCTCPLGSKREEIYLIKTDASGDTLWTRRYGGEACDHGYAVQETFDGGYIVAGCTYSSDGGGYDAYLTKTDAFGEMLWARTYGGKGCDYGYAVEQTPDGGYVIAGCTDSTSYLTRTDSSGNAIWTKHYGPVSFAAVSSVRVTSDNGYVIIGSHGAVSDVHLTKTDANGETMWTRTYGGQGDDCGYSVQQTSDGGYIVAGVTCPFGVTDQDVYLIKTDVSGNIVWTRTYGGDGCDYGYVVQETSDGGYIVAGSYDSFCAYDYDVYLIRTDAHGDTLWTRTYGGDGWDDGYSVEQTSDGGYVVAGGSGSFGEAHLVYLIKVQTWPGFE
jgi:hypothetical protein